MSDRPARAGSLVPEALWSLYVHADDGIAIVAPGDRILAANPAACQMLRLSEKEILARGRHGVTAPSDRARTDAAAATRLETGGVRLDVTFLRGDGTTFIGDVTSISFGSGDEPSAAWVVFRDVSEHRRAEAAAEALSEITMSLLAGEATPKVLGTINRESRRLAGADAAWVSVLLGEGDDVALAGAAGAAVAGGTQTGGNEAALAGAAGADVAREAQAGGNEATLADRVAGDDSIDEPGQLRPPRAGVTEAAQVAVAALDGVGIGSLNGLVTPWSQAVLTRRIVDEGVVVIDDLSAGDADEPAGLLELGPALGVRLSSGERHFGVLVVARREGAAPFDPAEVTLVQTFAHSASVALAFAAARTEVERLRDDALRLEGEHQRHMQALEINDTIVQTLCVAKWRLESGDSDHASELLTGVIERAQRIISNLLPPRVTGVHAGGAGPGATAAPAGAPPAGGPPATAPPAGAPPAGPPA
ncbi:MAG TPA: PAS domain S-box protein [Acidimicrobiales bacterium]|nr:PAS domain S-box protein [Acidimicrobiales bacterium]